MSASPPILPPRSPPLHARLSHWISPPSPDSPRAPILVSKEARGTENRPAEMAGIVSASMGVMNPLLGKLAMLLGDEYKTLTEVRNQAAFLMRELSAMKAALEKLELMDELDPLAKNWRDHVREMSYDMENCVDDLMRDLGDADANASFIRKNTKRFKAFCARYRTADKIKELKDLAIEANDRRIRYKIDDCVNSTSLVIPVDPRVSAIYKEAAGLVGIDGPKKVLVSWLTDTQEKLKVVSIVGLGGLGKTTLAKQVYDTIEGKFSCKAFVSVSQRPDMSSLLSGLELKLGMERSSRACEVQDIIDRLREHLNHKRYLIVVDDLWDQSAWNIINCVFEEGGNGSRVIVTTRVNDLAVWVCRNDYKCIYRMKPLEEQDSRMLFFNRIFGSEDGCPPQFKEVSAEILKKCGGLPLAIITIASLLASHQGRSRSEWESIRNSLGAKLATKPTLEDMRSILNLSYMHLPLHLRACFLYLGLYPEDCEIKRDDLIRQWVAEGFVSNLHGSDLEDVAKSYFNELINRSMIQPECTVFRVVFSCKVHDMMLDLILSKCAEDNFISVAYNYEDMSRLHGCEYKVRRLCLNSSNGGDTVAETTAASLSQVRSFVQIGKLKYTPPLLFFNYVRVLVLEFPWNLGTPVDLSAVGQFFQLRYLKVSALSSSIGLPLEIGGLVHLETLEINSSSAINIPSDIVLLSRLSCLILPSSIELPKGIKNIKSLRTLCCSNIGVSLLEDITGLGELTNLRELTLSNVALEAVIDALVSSIEKLRELRSLNLESRFSIHSDNQLYSLSNPPPHIEELYLQGSPFKRVPKWIGSLHYLRSLILRVDHLSTAEVHLVGKLSSLIHLAFSGLRVPQDGAAIICTGLFPILEFIGLTSNCDDATACMRFEAGVMPNLQQLTLGLCDKWGGAMPVGMEHLLTLERIHLEVDFSLGKHHDVVVSAFKNTAQVHPSHPSVTSNHYFSWPPL